jgi:NAD(P)-binding Rossmann-like domain
MREITIVGGGLAGMTAAITAAEGGAPVRLLEAHDELGGRARTSDGPYRANLGPHVLYKDGSTWAWLRDRDLLPPAARPPLGGIRVRWQGEVRRMPPLASIPTMLRLRGREAPVDRSFFDWVADHSDEETAAMLSAAAGVYTFFHDPGCLSAAFVWPRTVRALLSPPPAARYLIGGWEALVESLSKRMRELGVDVRTGERAETLPDAPAIVATELPDASRLLGAELDWPSGNTVCLDLGLSEHTGDPFIVSDLDEAGWIERFTAPDPSLAPDGEELVQAQMPVRPGESLDGTTARLERLLDGALEAWRDRVTWRRRQVMNGRTGALDMPGTTWRDRPGIDRGDGIFLAGDATAAPGMLSEVAHASGIEAARGALAYAASTSSTPGASSSPAIRSSTADSTLRGSSRSDGVSSSPGSAISASRSAIVSPP